MRTFYPCAARPASRGQKKSERAGRSQPFRIGATPTYGPRRASPGFSLAQGHTVAALVEFHRRHVVTHEKDAAAGRPLDVLGRQWIGHSVRPESWALIL